MEMNKELIDKLLGDYQKPEDLIGENGLLRQLTKAVIERALLSNLTEAVIEEVKAWQTPPLDAVYPVVYLDALAVKIRADGGKQCDVPHTSWCARSRPWGGPGPLMEPAVARVPKRQELWRRRPLTSGTRAQRQRGEAWQSSRAGKLRSMPRNARDAGYALNPARRDAWNWRRN